jgi:hypothetical protein
MLNKCTMFKTWSINIMKVMWLYTIWRKNFNIKLSWNTAIFKKLECVLGHWCPTAATSFIITKGHNSGKIGRRKKSFLYDHLHILGGRMDGHTDECNSICLPLCGGIKKSELWVLANTCRVYQVWKLR